MASRAGRTRPSTLIVLLLVAGGALFLLRGRAQRAPGECEKGADGFCVEAPARPLGATAAPATGPRLEAANACRDAAYLCAALDSLPEMHVYRWRDFKGTMVVHVPLPDLPDAALAHTLQRAATAGVRLWNGQPFPILVDERGTRPAQIEVRWVPSLSGSAIGLAHWVWSGDRGMSVKSLDLVTFSPHTGRPVDPAQLRLTAMHEMGHALGLPHSDNPHDVMYPVNTANGLSARDYRALEALYALPDGAVIVR